MAVGSFSAIKLLILFIANSSSSARTCDWGAVKVV
jgi:hypothetical protein